MHSLGQSRQRHDPYILSPTLDRGHIRTVDSRTIGQILLRQSAFKTSAPNCSTQGDQDRVVSISGGNGWHSPDAGATMPIAPRTIIHICMFCPFCIATEDDVSSCLGLCGHCEISSECVDPLSDTDPRRLSGHVSQSVMSPDTFYSEMPLPSWLGFATDITSDQVIGPAYEPGFERTLRASEATPYVWGKALGRAIALPSGHKPVSLVIVFCVLSAVVFWLYSKPATLVPSSPSLEGPSARRLGGVTGPKPTAATSAHVDVSPKLSPPTPPAQRAGETKKRTPTAHVRNRQTDASQAKEPDHSTSDGETSIDWSRYRRLVEGL